MVLPADRQPRGREGAPGLSRWTRPSPCSRQAALASGVPAGQQDASSTRGQLGGFLAALRSYTFLPFLYPKKLQPGALR